MPRIRSKKLVTRTGVTLTEAYCRKCQRTLPASSFYSATDTFLDSNGIMSICSDCIDKIYTDILLVTNSIPASVKRVCRMLNVAFVPSAMDAATKDAQTREANGSKASRFFGKYKSRIINMLRTGIHDNSVDMTYKEDGVMVASNETVITHNDTPDFEQLKKFWGTDSRDDIGFLEREMGRYRSGYVLDTPAQETLVKELCYLILEIDKDRKQDKSVDSKLKSLSALMNSMGISPNMESAASGGKASEAFGVWIRDIEETTPAEWYKDKSIHADVDNVEEYAEKYIVSPIRSFITGNKEFDITIEEDGVTDDEDDSEE